jgi:hypothetical protein
MHIKIMVKFYTDKYRHLSKIQTVNFNSTDKDRLIDILTNYVENYTDQYVDLPVENIILNYRKLLKNRATRFINPPQLPLTINFKNIDPSILPKTMDLEL